MHWLASHYQWLVAVVLMPIILLLLRQWADSRKKTSTPVPAPQETLNAQNSQVSNSPVAAGSGITQTISETHHHHYPPPAAAPSAAPEAESERPRPNLTIVGGRKILIHQGLEGAFYESGQGREQGEAVVVDVTNDAQRGASNVGAVVKATLIYQDAGQTVLRGMGSWLGQGSAMMKFRVDDSHSVVLGVVFNGQFSVPTKRMTTHGISRTSFPTDRNLLNCARATVTVRLTNADTGDLYCEERFEIVTNPLNISPA